MATRKKPGKADARRRRAAAARGTDDEIAAAGWEAICERLSAGRYRMSDDYLTMLVAKAEVEIPTRPHAVRHWIAEFLVAAGSRSSSMEEVVLAATDRIGPFETTPGETVDIAAAIQQRR